MEGQAWGGRTTMTVGSVQTFGANKEERLGSFKGAGDLGI